MEPPASPGSPLRISATDYNAAVEAGRRWRDQGRLGRGPYSSTPQIVPSIVKVRNSTSGSLAAGSVVELNATPMGELSRRNLVFDGVARAGVDPFCAVLINPLDQLEIGPAVIAGAVMAPVNIVDGDNTHARVEVGSTALKGDFGGWCRILYKPSGTGVKTCVVSLGHNEEIIRKARTTQSIAQGSSGTVDLFLNGSSRGQATAHYNWFSGGSSIANGADVLVEYSHDEDKWIIIPPPGGAAPLRWTQMVSSSNNGSWWWWQSGSPSRDTSSPIELTTSGVFAFPRFGLGTYSNSVGTAFSLVASPTTANQDCITFTQKAFYSLCVSLTWGLPSMTSSQWNFGYRDSADHTHQYNDSGVVKTTDPASVAYPSRDTRQAVTIITEVNGVDCGRSSIPNFYSADDDTDRYATHTQYLQLDRSFALTGLSIKFRRMHQEVNNNYATAEPYVSRASVRLEQISDNL